ncbi:AraC family transcriptional regulator, partial [Pseudomonas monteilii]|nr:AraC family transcriptional regulator [Pseudomonas monteilii]
YSQRMLKNILDTFFIRLLRGLQTNQVSLDTEAGEESEIIDMLQYLQNHFAEVSIADLSKKFNYSQRQIARILKNKTGKTFSQLILEMKISKAKVYLKQTNLPIQEIAELVGYGDLSNFYRYFFKVTGCSPKQFREMN